MKIADLFVKVGMQGADEVGKGLKEFEKALKGSVESSFAAIAAIGGIGFALGELVTHAGGVGQHLKNFAIETGVSTTTLQKFNYEAAKFGISSDSMEKSIYGLQDTIKTMMLHGEIPKYARLLGLHLTQDPINMLGQLSKAIKRIHDPALARKLTEDFHVEALFPMLRTTDWKFLKLPKDKFITPEEIERTNSFARAWGEFKQNAGIATTKITADLLPIGTLTELVKLLIQATDGFVKLSHAAHGFAESLEQVLGKLKIGQFLGSVFSHLVPGMDTAKSLVEYNKTQAPGAKPAPSGQINGLGDIWSAMTQMVGPSMAEKSVPPVFGPQLPAGQTSKTFQLNNTFNIHGKDAEQNADAARKHFSDAYYQIQQEVQ